VNEILANKEFLFKLAVLRATDVSSKAGIGWSLFDDDQRLVHYNACMTGTDAGRLIRDIRQYGQQSYSLFISSEPSTVSFDMHTLTNELDKSEIQIIYIGKSFEEDYGNRVWRAWARQWRGNIEEFSYNPVFEQLTLGEQMLRLRQRPWVIATAAEDCKGNTLPLTALTREFDVVNFLSILTQQSRAVLYSPSQQDIIEYLPDENNAFEPIELFQVYDNNNIETIFKYCAQESRCSALALSDDLMLSSLIANDLVDEIVYHSLDSTSLRTDSFDHLIRCTDFRPNDWRVEKTSRIGSYQRTILNKTHPNVQRVSKLRRWLN